MLYFEFNWNCIVAYIPPCRITEFTRIMARNSWTNDLKRQSLKFRPIKCYLGSWRKRIFAAKQQPPHPTPPLSQRMCRISFPFYITTFTRSMARNSGLALPGVNPQSSGQSKVILTIGENSSSSPTPHLLPLLLSTTIFLVKKAPTLPLPCCVCLCFHPS